MTDGLIASRIARMEHEERVRAHLREEQLLNDILPDEYDAWITLSAGNVPASPAWELLVSAGKGLVSLAKGLISLTHRPAATLSKPITGQKRRTMAG